MIDEGSQKPFGQEPADAGAKIDRLSAAIPQLVSRRDAITGLTVLGSSLLAGRAVVADPAPPPLFTSGRYQFTLLRPQRLLPSVRLFHLDGGSLDLASFRGRPLLVNFWATWCAACRVELPALDRLSASKRGLSIIAISESRVGREQVGRFVQSLMVRNLPIYLDPNGYVAHSDAENRTKALFALYGMPITYLVGSSGRILGYVPGAADWTEPAAEALIEYLGSA